MSTFEYVIVLVSMVLSLGLTQALAGLAQLMQHRGRVRLSLVHALWWLLTIGFHLDLWLSLWTLRDVKVWSLPAILACFLAACMVFLTAALATPRVRDEVEPIDLWAFHTQNRRRYIGATMAYGVLGGTLNATLLPASFNLANLTSLVPMMVLCLAGMLFSNVWMQRIIVVVSVGIFVTYMSGFFAQLS